MTATTCTRRRSNTRRETVDRKAWRLTQAQAVTWLSATVAQVVGDGGTYLVDRLPLGAWRCNCEWGRQRPDDKPCSHVHAAALSAPPADVKKAPVSAPRCSDEDLFGRCEW